MATMGRTVHKLADAIGSGTADPSTAPARSVPVPQTSIENKPAPGLQGPAGLGGRSTYSRVNTGVPPTPDMGMTSQKSQSPRGLESLPKIASQERAMTNSQTGRPTLQTLIKTAMSGAVARVDVSLEASRQIANAGGTPPAQEKTAAARKPDHLPTELTDKLAAALDFMSKSAFDLDAQSVDGIGPGEGPNALEVTQANADGENIDAGESGSADLQTPMNPETQKDPTRPADPGTGLETNDDMSHPEQPVEPISNEKTTMSNDEVKAASVYASNLLSLGLAKVAYDKSGNAHIVKVAFGMPGMGADTANKTLRTGGGAVAGAAGGGALGAGLGALGGLAAAKMGVKGSTAGLGAKIGGGLGAALGGAAGGKAGYDSAKSGLLGQTAGAVNGVSEAAGLGKVASSKVAFLGMSQKEKELKALKQDYASQNPGHAAGSSTGAVLGALGGGVGGAMLGEKARQAMGAGGALQNIAGGALPILGAVGGYTGGKMLGKRLGGVIGGAADEGGGLVNQGMNVIDPVGAEYAARANAIKSAAARMAKVAAEGEAVDEAALAEGRRRQALGVSGGLSGMVGLPGVIPAIAGGVQGMSDPRSSGLRGAVGAGLGGALGSELGHHGVGVLGSLAGNALGGQDGATAGGNIGSLLGRYAGGAVGSNAGYDIARRAEPKMASVYARNLAALGLSKVAEDAIDPAEVDAETMDDIGAAFPDGSSPSEEGVPSEPSDVESQKNQMLDSNEAAINYTKRDAKGDPKSDLGDILSEDALSSSTDKTLDETLDHTDEAGAKISSARAQSAAAKAILAKLAGSMPKAAGKKTKKSMMGGGGSAPSNPQAASGFSAGSQM